MCMGLREFCQTVAVGCSNCSSTFRGRKAENTAAAPSHTARTVVSDAFCRASIPTTLANAKMATLLLLSDYRAISRKVYCDCLNADSSFFFF